MTNQTPNTETQAQTTGATSTGSSAPQPVATSTTAPDARQLTREEFEALDENSRLKVVLLEEQIDVKKQTRQMGEVTITKRVVEEQINVPVTLRHEEVVMTRNEISVPLDAQSGASSEVFQEQTIKIRLHEEIPHVTKTTHVSGEMEITKRLVSEQKTISDSVRHEEADIKSPANVRVLDADRPL